MYRFKQSLCLMLTMMVLFLLCSPGLAVHGAEFILDPSKAQGSHYTQSKELARRLNQVFSGDIDLYTNIGCTDEVSMPLGTSLNNSTQYYIKSKTTGSLHSGWQCYIYANAAYNQLFWEWVGKANGFALSRIVISGGGNSLSYETLSKADVRCGAYLRTTANADGSFNGNYGHSIVLLSYDKTAVTYLEGNADGKGLVRITTRTWSDFNYALLTRQNRYIAHIVQPTNAVYDQLLGICTHEHYNSQGRCEKCGVAYDWESTFYAGAAGEYRTLQAVTPRTTSPYDTMTASAQLAEGTTVQVDGTWQNALGQVWYGWKDSKGVRQFVPSSTLELVKTKTLSVVCSGFSPAHELVLERKSQPVKGTVTSTYPIHAIYGYLDGTRYAGWTATDHQTTKVDLQATDLNRLLTFSTLPKGRHTITIEILVYGFEDLMLMIHESVFYMETTESCKHSYEVQTTLTPGCTVEGLRTYTCSLCGDSFLEASAALGHNYVNDTCTLCGSTRLLQLEGTVKSHTADGVRTKILLHRGGETVAQALTNTGGYQFDCLTAGAYTLEIQKEGCVTRTYEVTVSEESQSHSGVLFAPGDVTGDGVVNVADTAKVYAHVRNTAAIDRLYELKCADLNGDGQVNIGDTALLYARTKGLS